DSSELAAIRQAERVVHELGGRILADDEVTALTAAVAGSPWSGPGVVAAVALLPAHTGEFLSSMSATCDALALRPLLGTGEVRFAPEALTTVRTAVRAAGGRLVVRRGDAIVPDE